MTALVRLDRVTAAYGERPVLVDASLTVEPGAFTGIVGPSGSGKTTLLRCVLGSVRPVAGSVWRAPGLRVAYVPQTETVNWNFPVTVAEVVRVAGGAAARELYGSGGRWRAALSPGLEERLAAAAPPDDHDLAPPAHREGPEQ